MRLPPIPPSELNDEQRDLDDTLRAGIAKQFQGFQTARADGALLGPFKPWLHEPRIGRAVWELTEAVSACGALPDNARQVAILATGARFKAAFELYAHVRIARDKGLAPDKIATITAGQRPADLSPTKRPFTTRPPRSTPAACCRGLSTPVSRRPLDPGASPS